MSPPKSKTSKAENRILLMLPASERKQLASESEVVSLALNEVLFEAGDCVDHAYFLNSGMVSLIAVGEDGNSIEVGVIGDEGMLPFQIESKPQEMPYRCIVQVPGSALKIGMESLREQLRTALNERSLPFVKMLHNQSCQSTLCNRFHTMEQRLCRWLLISGDHAGKDQFPSTHKHLSYMLGANRSNVTVALGKLKSQGLISYRQGTVTILDRRRMAIMACVCYTTYKKKYQELHGSRGHNPRIIGV